MRRSAMYAPWSTALAPSTSAAASLAVRAKAKAGSTPAADGGDHEVVETELDDGGDLVDASSRHVCAE